MIDWTVNVRDPALIGKSANFLLAIVWKNVANKAKVAAKGACVSLLKRIIRHAHEESDEYLRCIENMSLALSSLLLFPSNFEKITGCNICCKDYCCNTTIIFYW